MTNVFKRLLYEDEPKYLAFMLALVFLLVGQSLFEQESFGARLVNLTFLLVFITTFFAVWHNLWLLLGVIALGLPMFSLQIMVTVFDLSFLTTISYVFGMLFFALMFISIMYHILKTSSVSMNTIYGAVSAYLLIGVSFAFVFGIILQLEPSALGIPRELLGNTDSERQPFDVLTYFSFTSLTTLGFGDINPVSPLARTLSYLEAVLGQLFLTILIARLVGLHISGTR